MYTLEEAFKLSYFALDSYFFRNEKKMGYEKTIDDLAVVLGAMDPYLCVPDKFVSADPAYYIDWTNLAKEKYGKEILTEEESLQTILSFLQTYMENYGFDLQSVIDYFNDSGIKSKEWKEGLENLKYSREEIIEFSSQIIAKNATLKDLNKKINLAQVEQSKNKALEYLEESLNQTSDIQDSRSKREKLQSIIVATAECKKAFENNPERNLYAIELREPTMKYLESIKNTIAQYDYFQFAANIFDLLKNPIVFQSIFKKDRKMDGEFFTEMEQLLGMVGVSDMLEGDLTSGEVLAVAVLVAGAVLTDILTQ